MKTFTPITFEDLKLSPADAELIRDGAARFVALPPDPEDDERLHEVVDGAGN